MKTNKIRQYWPLYLMLVPGTIYLLINCYFPMAGIVVAFKSFNYQKGIFGSPWNGLANFEFLFKTKDAWTITRNTLAYNLVFIIVGTVLAITVAIMLNEVSSKRAKKFYQTFILIPFLVSIVIVSYIVYGFFSTESGFINKMLENLGLSTSSWYSDPTWWPLILVMVNIWKNLGYNVVLYYATLVGIDPSYNEAATVDGASRWQCIWHITLPNLVPTVSILTLMAISRIFYSDFGLFYQVPMNSGPLIDVTNTIDTYVYRGLMETNNIGMSAAAGLYQSVVGFILVLVANTIVKIHNQENALF